MSAKHLKVIALTLAVLLLLWGATELFSRGSDSVTGSFTLAVPAATDGDTISLVRGADTIVLARQSPTAWSVNGHRAALDAVNELLAALTDSVRPELVAQESASFARLGVDSAAGRWLRLRRGGKAMLELVVGARGTDFQSVYLRRPGDTHVYLWSGRLGSVLDRATDAWRDKHIATLEPDSIVALEIVRGKDRYTLGRAGRRWTLNGGPTDSAAVAHYLERVKSITASGFATPQEAAPAGGRRSQRRFTVRGRGAVLLTLVLDSTATGFLVHHVAGVGGEGATV